MNYARGVDIAITQQVCAVRINSCIAPWSTRFACFGLVLFVWCEQHRFVDGGRWANAAAADSSAKFGVKVGHINLCDTAVIRCDRGQQ